MDARSAPDMALTPENQLTTILEGIGEGFYAVDRDWRIVLFNAQAAHHFGMQPSAALGRRIWRVADDRILLCWQERGGPAVFPWTHEGFGSRLIQRSLAAELLGDVKITFDAGGVVCTIDAPFDSPRDEHATA